MNFKMLRQSLIIFVLSTMLLACNAISTKNISNDFKWKKKKFDSIVYINYQYKPYILNKIISEELVFFKPSDTFKIDSVYKIESILKEKLKKRNILIGKSNQFSLSVDTLIFKENAEAYSVYNEGNNNEFIGVSEKDYFVFKIIGSVKKKTIKYWVSAENAHNTIPRESYTMSGIIVKDGINANPHKMIENALNEFTYRVYEKLK